MNTNKGKADEQKDKVRRRFRNTDATGLIVTPAKPKIDFANEQVAINVAVYARVSTDNVQQTSSFEIQQKYYTDIIDLHPNWTLVKIYADEGISGTSLKKRDAFQRMLIDCRDGKIELIIVKNVSRWSRNIIDGIGTVRELAGLNPPVGVYFENEGIHSLDPEKASMLQMHNMMSEQESRTKSASMVSSLIMRFSNCIFLTPPLLGYDNDVDGNLVINEEEASTVRLIFYMYLSGHTTAEIANALEATGRRTKPGNTKWSPGNVLGILKNERHCGDIAAWKTETPNFLDHKKRKNIDGKPKYYKLDHHEAIISRDDFMAAQQMIANAKYGGDSYLPRLRVNASGALGGFVSVNPRWGAFTAEDYINASESAEAGAGCQRLGVKVERDDFDLRGYKVVRTQFFTCANMNSMTFSPGSVRFSIDCIRKFGEAEYIELFVHPAMGNFVVCPCDKERKNAMRWAKEGNDKMYSRSISGAAFVPTLYDLFGWHPARKYRLRGELMQVGGKQIILFDAREPEIIISQDIVPPYTDDTSCLHELDCDGVYIASRSRKFVTALPIEWRDSFGEDYYRHNNIRIPDIPLDDKAIMYNSKPEINPTPYDVLGDNVDSLLRDMQNPEVADGSKSNFDAS